MAVKLLNYCLSFMTPILTHLQFCCQYYTKLYTTEVAVLQALKESKYWLSSWLLPAWPPWGPFYHHFLCTITVALSSVSMWLVVIDPYSVQLSLLKVGSYLELCIEGKRKRCMWNDLPLVLIAYVFARVIYCSAYEQWYAITVM